MKGFHHAVAVSLVLGLALLASPQEAKACGGCVAPVDSPFAVTGHRMAIKIGAGSTVLWDQFSWAGDPDDFAWILPLPAVGVVELAENGFFEALDDETAPRIIGPLPPRPPICEDDELFFGSPSTDAATWASTDSGVTVYYEGTVGPYETVTIGATDPNELYDWLIANDYAISEDVLPTIEWYVDLGSIFVALRLAPEFGIQEMTPVRVTYPMAAISFPLKMVAVGAAAELELTLFVISDRRYSSLNYPVGPIDPSELVWDSAIGRSNYTELYDELVAADGGRGWVTEYARPTFNLSFPYDWEEDRYPGEDDWATATSGFKSVWVTRMRTTIAPDNLDEDLFLEPAWDISIVENRHNVTVDLNPPPPFPPCPGDAKTPSEGVWYLGVSCNVQRAVGDAAGGNATLVLAALGLTLVLVSARKRRQKR